MSSSSQGQGEEGGADVLTDDVDQLEQGVTLHPDPLIQSISASDHLNSVHQQQCCLHL